MKQDLLGGVIVLATFCLLFCLRSVILSAGRHPTKQPSVSKSAEDKNKHFGGDTVLGASKDRQKTAGHIKPMAGEFARQERHKE